MQPDPTHLQIQIKDLARRLAAAERRIAALEAVNDKRDTDAARLLGEWERREREE